MMVYGLWKEKREGAITHNEAACKLRRRQAHKSFHPIYLTRNPRSERNFVAGMVRYRVE